MKNEKRITKGVQIAEKIAFYELAPCKRELGNSPKWQKTDTNIGEKLLSRSWKWIYLYNDDCSFMGIGLYFVSNRH